MLCTHCNKEYDDSKHKLCPICTDYSRQREIAENEARMYRQELHQELMKTDPEYYREHTTKCRHGYIIATCYKCN